MSETHGTGRGSRKPGVTLDHHGGDACLGPLLALALIYILNYLSFFFLLFTLNWGFTTNASLLGVKDAS